MKRFRVNKNKKKLNLVKKIFDFKTLANRPDKFLVLLFGILIVFGLIMLSSASTVESFRSHGNSYYFFWHQIYSGFLPGLILLILFSLLDYTWLEKYTMAFFTMAVFLLAIIFIPGLGQVIGNARSWVKLGVISFQPSEIVKLLLILFLAGWFSHRGQEMNKDFWNGLIPFGAILGLVSLLIILQPDLGTLVVLATIAIIMYFAAGGRMIHLFGLVGLGLGLVGLMVARAPYRAARLMVFLHPELDPQGIGYHINQAFLAIGSGGWFGLGFGQSRQKFAYLPEVMGDSIFAVISEELGFIVALAVIMAFVLIVWRGLKILKVTNDDYARLLIIGIVSWFIFQAFYNIGAMIGLLPLTGIPLPFISYGGTALASTMAASGILINISRKSTIE
ncbi:MAG: putative lipid II flippase FtsW [Patescibacteria group bacterium]|nr:putative lipid II flippase FtsW [Patescibacteria group bacterium]